MLIIKLLMDFCFIYYINTSTDIKSLTGLQSLYHNSWHESKKFVKDYYNLNTYLHFISSKKFVSQSIKTLQ
jgi:hypothetical protein